MEAKYEVLRPFVTERILSLTRGRLFEGLKFFERGTLRHEFGRGEVKLALLLVRIANSDEYLTGPELEVLEGRQYAKSSQSAVLQSQSAVLPSQGKTSKKRG